METLKTLVNKETIKELVSTVKDAVNDGRLANTIGCEWHNEIFNTDYFIIGYYAAEQWLIKNIGIFRAIELIKDYEESNFGDINTNFSSSEAVCNMTVYILGEYILSESTTLSDNWDNILSDEQIEDVINELDGI